MRGRLAVLAVLLALATPEAPAASACDQFWVGPTTQMQVGGAAGSATFTLNAPHGCTYEITASSGGRWLYVYPDGMHTMSGTNADLDVSWDANERGFQRTGTITIQGPGDTQFISIAQGGACAFSLSQSNFFYTKNGGSGSFDVTTGPDCDWQASSGEAWIGVGAAGRGSASVGFTVAANDASEGRVGFISVGSTRATVSQSSATSEGAPDAPPLGGRGSGGHDSIRNQTGGLLDDEDFAEMPGPEPWLALAVLGAAALALRRQHRKA